MDIVRSAQKEKNFKKYKPAIFIEYSEYLMIDPMFSKKIFKIDSKY